MELGGTATGQYDQIAVTTGSTLNLNDVTLQGSLVNGYTPATNDLLFLIINAGSVSGTFADAARQPDYDWQRRIRCQLHGKLRRG